VVNSVRAARGEPALDLSDMVAKGLIAYIPFPDALRGKYQCFTQADLDALRSSGCEHAFSDVAAGVAAYAQRLGVA
jgi:ADP-L-glycero-D-manno-heptose 6-epimerase